jgi:hypothetical protein
LFGLTPAWQGTRVNLASALKDDSQARGVRRSRFASTLIVGQISICLVLLIASSLCLRSLFNAQNVKLGFKIENRVTTEVNLKDYGYSAEQMKQFNDAFLERVAALPGIESVAIADYLPLDTRYLGITYNVEGREPPPQQEGHNLQTFDVGAGYFATMGTVLLRGREFARLTAKVPRLWPSSIRRWRISSGPAKTRLVIDCSRESPARGIPMKSSAWWRTASIGHSARTRIR